MDPVINLYKDVHRVPYLKALLLSLGAFEMLAPRALMNGWAPTRVLDWLPEIPLTAERMLGAGILASTIYAIRNANDEKDILVKIHNLGVAPLVLILLASVIAKKAFGEK